jgi:hypothetical protein
MTPIGDVAPAPARAAFTVLFGAVARNFSHPERNSMIFGAWLRPFFRNFLGSRPFSREEIMEIG